MNYLLSAVLKLVISLYFLQNLESASNIELDGHSFIFDNVAHIHLAPEENKNPLSVVDGLQSFQLEDIDVSDAFYNGLYKDFWVDYEFPISSYSRFVGLDYTSLLGTSVAFGDNFALVGSSGFGMQLYDYKF
jgi:hypothetical protein